MTEEIECPNCKEIIMIEKGITRCPYCEHVLVMIKETDNTSFQIESDRKEIENETSSVEIQPLLVFQESKKERLPNECLLKRECPFCFQYFKSRKKLKSHMKEIHDKNINGMTSISKSPKLKNQVQERIDQVNRIYGNK